jgi:hypothetical protein
MRDVGGFDADSQPFDRPRLVEVGELATRQGGVISREQLLALGVTGRAIAYWLASGRLYRVFRGVYALGHMAITEKGRLFAAVLACGNGAVLSHRSAATWRGIWRSERRLVDVTVLGRTRTGQDGIDLHRVRRLDPRDVSVHQGIPVTGIPRTLLDFAEVAPARHLKRLIEETDRQRLFDGKAVHELLARSPGRHGLKPLRVLLSDFAYDPHSRQELEARFFDLCKDAELPLPAMNAVVAGREVDAHWAGTRLVVELDGWEFHRTQAAFERDRLKDQELIAAGYVVMRITWRQLTEEPEAVAMRLRKLLLRA